jgi:integrase
VDTLPVPPQVVPFLEHALAESGSEYMFPGPDGGMRSKDNDMARLTQVICKRAGLVQGYDHSCRRCKKKGKPVGLLRDGTPPLQKHSPLPATA